MDYVKRLTLEDCMWLYKRNNLLSMAIADEFEGDLRLNYFKFPHILLVTNNEGLILCGAG